MRTKAGDVIIWRKVGTSVCEVAVVNDDGGVPGPAFNNRWQTKGGKDGGDEPSRLPELPHHLIRRRRYTSIGTHHNAFSVHPAYTPNREKRWPPPCVDEYVEDDESRVVLERMLMQTERSVVAFDFELFVRFRRHSREVSGEPRLPGAKVILNLLASRSLDAIPERSGTIARSDGDPKPHTLTNAFRLPNPPAA